MAPTRRALAGDVGGELWALEPYYFVALYLIAAEVNKLLTQKNRPIFTVGYFIYSDRMNSTQEGYTDDMSVPLQPGQRVEEIVAFVIQQALIGTADDDNEAKLVSLFGFSPEDAELVRDRVFGGIVRAATGNKTNRPSSKKDPFAYASFKQAMQDTSIITSIYPQFSRPAQVIQHADTVQPKKRHWWKIW